MNERESRAATVRASLIVLLLVPPLGLAAACDSSPRSSSEGGSSGAIAAGSSTPGAGRGGEKGTDAGVSGASSTLGLELDDGEVVVSEIYRLCTHDTDCILVDTSCNGCCGQDAIARTRQSSYAQEHAAACRGYDGPVCDCETRPASARCVAARCRMREESETCYSPTQNLERAFEPGTRACACELEGQRACALGVPLVCRPVSTAEPVTPMLEWSFVRDAGCDMNVQCPEVDQRPTVEACLREYMDCRMRDDGATYCGRHCYGALDCSTLDCEDYAPASPSCDPEGGPWEGLCSDSAVRYRIKHTGETRYWDRASGALIGLAAPNAWAGACNGTESSVLLGDATLLTRCPVHTDDGTSVCLQDRCSDTAATRVADGCELELSAPLPTDAHCRAVVELNGQILACNDPNGWTGLDRFHIRLDGDACSALQASDATVVRVRVPCSDLPL